MWKISYQAISVKNLSNCINVSHIQNCAIRFSSIQNRVHSGSHPLGIVSIWGCVYLGWRSFWIAYIRDCVHSGSCPFGNMSFGIVSIRDGVYSGWCIFGNVSIRYCVFWDCVQDPMPSFFGTLVSRQFPTNISRAYYVINLCNVYRTGKKLAA